jgi:Tol biopolymer transport system component
MRLARIISFLTAWFLLAGLGSAASPELVSRDAAGSPGQADSGSVRGGTEMRSSAVLDDGAVFFLSLAQLTPADTNVVTDYYCRNSAGTVTAVDLPTELVSGHFFWGGTDAGGTTFYLFRQFPDPSQFELRIGTLAAKTSLGVRSLIYAADFARGGGYAVYERDVSGFRHLFFHDLTSAPRAETQFTSGSNGDSRDPAISADGTVIVFSSRGSNVVPNDVNGVADVFRYDRTIGTSTLISQRLNHLVNADAVTPGISADGLVICFASADDSFVPGDTNARSDVFVSVGGAMQRCSVASDGIQANADSNSPQLNADGRFVVFVSRASNLAPGVDNGHSQIFLYDRDVGLVEALSLDAGGVPANADCFVPAISSGGRYVTFVSKATNLVDGVAGTWYQVYRVDRGPDFANHPPVASSISLAAAAGETFRFRLTATDADQDPIAFVLADLPAQGTVTDANGSALLSGHAYGATTFPWHFVPADGSVFADHFTFRATDGKALSAVATGHIRMVDQDFGAVTRLSIASDGTQSTLGSYLPYPGLGMSAEGGLVAFSSVASELDSTDNDVGFADIFVRDTVAGSTRLLTTGIAANRNSYRCAVAGDGRSVVYYTEDGNALIQQSLADGTRVTLATVSSYLSNSGPAVADDGTRTVFEKNGKVWLYDGETRATTEVSVTSHGETADASCGDIAISADGRVVAFRSGATNLAAGNPGGTQRVYLRLLDRAETVMVSATPAGQPVENAVKPALSGTGRYVVFLADDGTVGDGIGTVYVKDVGTGALVQVAASAANPTISADGRFVCYTSTGANARNQLFRVDLAANRGPPQIVSNAAGLEGNGDSYRGVLSATGRLVAFASNATNLVAGDTNAACDIFLADFGIPQNSLPVPTLTSLSTDKNVPLVEVALTCTDAEQNDIRIEIVSGPTRAAQFVLNGLRPGHETVTFTYVPRADYSGLDSFSYRCRDGEGWSVPVTVTITVNPEDLPPQLTLSSGQFVMATGTAQGVIPQDMFELTDPDDPDGPSPTEVWIEILSEPVTGVLLDKDGIELHQGDRTLLADFPLTYQAHSAGEFATEWISFRASGADWTSAAVELEVVVGAVLQTLALKTGWNLISFKMDPLEPDPTTLFAREGWARAVGPVWFWDTHAGRYDGAQALVGGLGYWVFILGDELLLEDIPGSPIADTLLPVFPGWNLIGPVGYGAEGDPPGATDELPGPLWQWDTRLRCYRAAERLFEGLGYWLYSVAETAVELGLQ